MKAAAARLQEMEMKRTQHLESIARELKVSLDLMMVLRSKRVRPRS